MAKVYTRIPGAVMEIGHYGPASNDVAAVVPEAVAEELAGREDLRIERDAAASEPLKLKVKKEPPGPPPAGPKE